MLWSEGCSFVPFVCEEESPVDEFELLFFEPLESELPEVSFFLFCSESELPDEESEELLISVHDEDELSSAKATAKG